MWSEASNEEHMWLSSCWPRPEFWWRSW